MCQESRVGWVRDKKIRFPKSTHLPERRMADSTALGFIPRNEGLSQYSAQVLYGFDSSFNLIALVLRVFAFDYNCIPRAMPDSTPL